MLIWKHCKLQHSLFREGGQGSLCGGIWIPDIHKSFDPKSGHLDFECRGKWAWHLWQQLHGTTWSSEGIQWRSLSISNSPLRGVPPLFQVMSEWLVIPVSHSYTVKGSVSQVERTPHRETHSSSDSIFCALLSCSQLCQWCKAPGRAAIMT